MNGDAHDYATASGSRSAIWLKRRRDLARPVPLASSRGVAALFAGGVCENSGPEGEVRPGPPPPPGKGESG